MSITIVGTVAKEYLRKFQNVASRTLAEKMLIENPQVYTDIEHARKLIRYYRGAVGKHGAKSLKDKSHVIPHGGKRKGAGRKPAEPKVMTSIPARIVAAARKEKQRRGRGASIVGVITEWADNGRG